MRFTLVSLASLVGIGGSLLAVAVPAFVSGLSASRQTEALVGLDRIAAGAISGATSHPQKDSFPPSIALTPAEVPRGARVVDPPDTWEQLTWRALGFQIEGAHAYAFQFESSFDPVSGLARFAATAHGDLDGDGSLSTFQVQGERRPGEPAKVVTGLLVSRELE